MAPSMLTASVSAAIGNALVGHTQDVLVGSELTAQCLCVLRLSGVGADGYTMLFFSNQRDTSQGSLLAMDPD